MRLIKQLITHIRFIIMEFLGKEVITKYIIIQDDCLQLVGYRLPNSKKEPWIVVTEHYHVHYEDNIKYVIVKRFKHNQTQFKQVHMKIYLAMHTCILKSGIEHQLVRAAKEMKYESLTII